MAPFSDPHLDELVDQYFSHDCHPKFLYQGSQESIIEELKAWVGRRKEVHKAQMELRHEAQKASEEVYSSPSKYQDPEFIRVVQNRIARAEVLDNEANDDGPRAAYLLDVLKSRGVTWPEPRWQPETDGGVCSFLGTVDANFDAHATLTILEAKEEEEGLQANAAKIQAHFSPILQRVQAKLAEKRNAAGSGQTPTEPGQASGSPGESSSNGAWTDGKPAVVKRAEDKLMLALAKAFDSGFGNGQAGGSDKKKSRQEKRAEDREETKAKARDSKQAKD